MKDKLIKIAGRAVEKARTRGVEAEGYVLHSEDLTIEVIDGQVETMKEAEEIGLGIRVFNGRHLGFAFTTDLGEKSVQTTVERAIEASKYGADDDFNGLFAQPGPYPEMVVFDPATEETELEAKIELAREVERRARAFDKRVRVIERAGYEDSRYSVAVVSSQGIEAFEKGSFCGIYILLVAEEDGDAQNGFALMARRQIADLDPVQVGQEGAMKALRILQAKTVASQSLPCMLEPQVMTSFLGVLAGSFGADAVQKGKSGLFGKLGQQIAASGVILIDDGTYQQGVASFPFDGEGWPCQRTVLVEDGILKGFMYDTYTARKDQTVSTGNGMRGSFRGLPTVDTTNFFLQPGKDSPEGLRKDLSRGLYVVEVLGMHTANPISGDFSVGASGIMIENGELTYPVRGITIAGNLFEFLKDIEGIGDDLRFFGGTGSPSVRVKRLSVGGT